MRATWWFRGVAGWAGVVALGLGLPCWAGPSASGALGRWTKGDAPGARREYEELLAKSPGDARLSFNAGVAAHQMGDWEAAGRHHEAALASPDLGLQQRAFFGLGNARFRQGEAATEGAEKARLWEDAARQYQAALGLNPADTAARENLEAVREQLARLQREQPKEEGKQDGSQQGQQDPDKKKPEKDAPKDGQKGGGKDSQKRDAGQDGDSGEEQGQGGEQQGGKDGGKDRQGKQGGDKKDGASRQQGGTERKDGGKDGASQESGGGARMEEKKSKDGKEGAAGQRGKEGKEGKEGDGTPRAAGRQPGQGEAGDGEGGEGASGGGAAAHGQPGVMSGEDGVDGKMAMRFAERLLDAHKREERALIWAAPRAPFQDGRHAGRKTW